MKYKILFLCILAISFSCKSISNKINYDFYQDSYIDNNYIFEPNGFSIKFDESWKIVTKYYEFSDINKKYAESYKNELGESIFFGSKSEKRLFVRATVNEFNLSNIDFFNMIEQANLLEIQKYDIKYLSPEKYTIIETKHLSALNFVNEISLASDKTVYFDSWLIRGGKYNIRIDFWSLKSLYTSNDSRKYIENIIESAEFIIND